MRGKDVVVITSRVDPATASYEFTEGVHVYRLPCIRLPKLQIALNFPWLNASFFPGNMKRINGIIARHRPDVLHLHNHMFDLAFRAVRVRQKFGIPLVVTIHTMIRHSQPAYNIFLTPADRIFLKQAVVQHADAIVSPDVNISEYVREAFGTKNDVIVRYGIEKPATPDPARIQGIRRRYGLDGKRVILSIGHVHKIRDRKELIQALPTVLKKIPDAKLMIVGAVSTDIPVRTAKRLGVESAVIFTGPVPHSELGDYLSLADIEAHWLNQDSPDKTSLGVASLECMAAGKAVLSIANEDTYGVGVLRNGENVLLLQRRNPKEIAEMIIGVLKDSDRRLALGQNANATLDHYFSWKRICSDTLAVYETALNRFQCLKSTKHRRARS